MRLIGREKLSCLRDSSTQVEKWVSNWVAEVMNAHWKCPSDVSTQFPYASHIGDGLFKFPMKNCDWVIHLQIAFPKGIALITDLKTKNGTHGH